MPEVPIERPASSREPTGRRTSQQRAGGSAEQLVADWLASRGWQILGRNVHAGRHELDIVAADPGPPARLVVVEVKWRRSRSFGLPEETVDWRKRGHLRQGVARIVVAGQLPDGTALPPLPFAVDVAVVEPGQGRGSVVRHLRDVL